MPVFEWDARSHGFCYDMWERGILSDGGEGARRTSQLSGEALVEGMLVGTEKNLMNTSELHQVYLPICFRRRYPLTHPPASIRKSKVRTGLPESMDGFRRRCSDHASDAVGGIPAQYLGQEPPICRIHLSVELCQLFCAHHARHYG